MLVRIYLQSPYLKEVTLVEVNADADAKALKAACIKVLPQDVRHHGFYLSEESSEDDEFKGHVKNLSNTQGIRVHLNRCKHILTTVQYQGETVTKKFRPSTTIGRVKTWSGKKFGMESEDIAEHVLQLLGHDTQPDDDQHIGQFACQESCSVGFDLVPCHRING